MADSPFTDISAESDAAHGRVGMIIVQTLLISGEVLALVGLIDRMASGQWVQAACLSQFILAMLVASGSTYCASRRRRQLYEPIDRLAALLPEIHAGRRPAEELRHITGRIAPIAQQFLEVYGELRTNKSEINSEIRQRIASKTEALERKIGSLKNQATRDVLTGLLNRRALNEHLTHAIERCAKSDLPISVLMIDVDNFKPLNDTLGHAAGDDLLRSIGQIFRSTLREGDVAFRCGGDEFVVVLEGSDFPSATALSKRLTALVDGLAKTYKVAAPPRLSIGAAGLYEVPEATAEALLHEADTRLYAIKAERKRANGAVNPRDAAVLQRAGAK